jgi:tetratricopeptide (TPR) repeat protein
MGCFERRTLWVPIAFVAVVATTAHADPPTERSEAARYLFDEGRALMADKNYAAACPKFEKAQRLDPGGGTLLNLALCNELIGKTATAYAHFLQGLQIARQDNRKDREELAQQHIDALRPRLSYLRVVVPDGVRQPGLTISLDGLRFADEMWSTRVPVDPGEHVVEATAPAKHATRLVVTVGSYGDAREVVLDSLRDEPQEATAQGSNVPERPASTTAHAQEAGTGSGQRLTGAIVGGVGLAALATSGVLSLRSLHLSNRADEECPDRSRCAAVGVEDSRDAVRFANFGTGFALGGLVLTGLGAYLFLSAPRQARPPAMLDIAPGRLAIRISARF